MNHSDQKSLPKLEPQPKESELKESDPKESDELKESKLSNEEHPNESSDPNELPDSQDEKESFEMSVVGSIGVS